MPVWKLLLILASLGVVIGGIVKWLDMPLGLKKLIILVGIVIGIIIALNAFGIQIPNPTVPQLK